MVSPKRSQRLGPAKHEKDATRLRNLPAYLPGREDTLGGHDEKNHSHDAGRTAHDARYRRNTTTAPHDVAVLFDVPQTIPS